MKAASLKNPFANLIASGYKTIETRIQTSSVAKTFHRGEMLICTSAKPHEQWEYIKQHYLNKMVAVPIDPYLKIVLDKIWIRCGESWQTFSQYLMVPVNEPSIVAVCELNEVKNMLPDHQYKACYSLFPGAKSLMLQNIKQVKPLPLKGRTNGFHLGVFDVEIDKSELIFL